MSTKRFPLTNKHGLVTNQFFRRFLGRDCPAIMPSTPLENDGFIEDFEEIRQMRPQLKGDIPKQRPRALKSFRMIKVGFFSKNFSMIELWSLIGGVGA